TQDDFEIDPFSIGGLAIVALAGLAFYAVYKVDQSNWGEQMLEKYGIWKGGTDKSLEEYLSIKQSHGGLHVIPDDWNAVKIIWDHWKNMVLGVWWWVKRRIIELEKEDNNNN
ncbi:hypothetical protein RFI_13353, partial [Reticulomyxa filosa]